MLTTLKSFLAGLMLAGLALGNFAQAQNGTEAQIITLTNNYRVQNGKARLTVSPVLQKVASQHAQNMANADKYGDSGQNGHILFGQDMVARVNAAGYKYLRIAENVAWNQGHADPVNQVVTMWTNSPGHQANMLNAEVTEFGVGAAKSASGKWYFVQVFGRPTTPATPPGSYNKYRTRIREMPNQKYRRLPDFAQ